MKTVFCEKLNKKIFDLFMYRFGLQSVGVAMRSV